MIQKKKILFFIKNLAGGGAEKVLLNLLNRLDKDRYDITVQTIFNQGIYIEQLPKYVQYKSVFSREFKGFVYLSKLCSPQILHKWFIKDTYDIEVAFLEGVCTRIISGCVKPGTKKISWLHTDFRYDKVFLKPYCNLAEAERVYNTFEQIVSVSESGLATLRAKIKLISPAQVIYNIIDVETILRLSKKPQNLIINSSSRIVLGAVGRLNHAKGYDRLIHVVSKLKKDGYAVSLYIFGEGSSKNSIQHQIEKEQLQDDVFILGFHENPYKFIKSFDLFVCSSYYEGFSSAVCEAVILGVPVITTDCSGMKEILGENNEFGLIVENSEEGLLQGIKQFLDNRSLLQYYQNKVKERMHIFSPGHTMKLIEDIFH